MLGQQNFGTMNVGNHFFCPAIFFAHNPMPISTSFPVQQFSQDEFGKVAYEVVGHAFDVHDALGKKFHESVYKGTLQQIIGPRSVTEFAITLSHGSFLKNLYVDLLVDAGCPFELKAVLNISSSQTFMQLGSKVNSVGQHRVGHGSV